MNLVKLLARPIAFHRCLMVNGDPAIGLFLSQALYWTGKLKDNRSGWFYKTADSWEIETGLTQKVQARVRRDLIQLNILEERLAGLPAVLWFRINLPVLERFVEESTKFIPTGEACTPNGINRDPPMVDSTGTETTSLSVSDGRRYPASLDEAKHNQPVSSTVPLDFVEQCWNKAESRGGHDAKNIPIADFNAYVRTEWKYEQDRIRSQTHQGNPSSGNRNARTYNEGRTAATGLTTADFARISQEKARKLDAEHMEKLRRSGAPADAGGVNGVPTKA